MRQSWIPLLALLTLTLPGNAQENPGNAGHVQQDSSAIQQENSGIRHDSSDVRSEDPGLQRDSSTMQRDSTSFRKEFREETGLEAPGDYLADSLQPSGSDTSYFSAGNPEYNLIQAADYGQVGVVRMLLDRGVDADARTDEGVTPLMYASQNGDTAVMACLIRHGADVNARPDNEVTPLISATRKEMPISHAVLPSRGSRISSTGTACTRE